MEEDKAEELPQEEQPTQTEDQELKLTEDQLKTLGTAEQTEIFAKYPTDNDT